MVAINKTDSQAQILHKAASSRALPPAIATFALYHESLDSNLALNKPATADG